MTTVSVSKDFTVPLPAEIRKALGNSAGEILQLIPYGNRLEIVRLKSVKEMRGFLPGVDTSVPRDEDRV